MGNYVEEFEHAQIKENSQNSGQIDKASTELAIIGKQLMEQISLLSEKLSPVLLPEHPSVLAKDRSDRPEAAPLANHLMDCNDGFNRVMDVLRDLINRIDL